jgi:hypothetical protein
MAIGAQVTPHMGIGRPPFEEPYGSSAVHTEYYIILKIYHKHHKYTVSRNTYTGFIHTYYYYPIYTTLIIPISYPSQFPQWHKLASTPEAVVGAHAQSRMEVVILHTLFTTFTFYSPQKKIGAFLLTETPTSKWCGPSQT